MNIVSTNIGLCLIVLPAKHVASHAFFSYHHPLCEPEYIHQFIKLICQRENTMTMTLVDDTQLIVFEIIAPLDDDTSSEIFYIKKEWMMDPYVWEIQNFNEWLPAVLEDLHVRAQLARHT